MPVVEVLDFARMEVGSGLEEGRVVVVGLVGWVAGGMAVAMVEVAASQDEGRDLKLADFVGRAVVVAV